MAVSAKTRAKRHARVSKGWRAEVPRFNIMDYKSSMMKLLAFFAANVENKEKQAMTISYWSNEGKKVTGLGRLSDGWFCQSGALVYLIGENIALEHNDVMHLDKIYHNLMERVSKLEEEKIVVKVSKPQAKRDASEVLAYKLGAEIDGEIEKAFSAKGKHNFDAKDFLVKNETSAAAAKIIAGFYKPTLKELKLAGPNGDYDHSEAYGWLGARGIKRMFDFIQSIIDSCETASTIAKTTRKPRARKEKPAAVLVSKMKYKKEDQSLKLKSITPDKIVGADEVWVFNTQYRKLFKYVAIDGSKLTVKGTTIQNFDPEKSGAKTIRKPDVFFPPIVDQTKRSWSKAFNEIKSVLAKATGRINEDVLIMKAF